MRTADRHLWGAGNRCLSSLSSFHKESSSREQYVFMSPEKISLYPSRSIKRLGCFVMACFCSTGKHLIRQRHNNDPSGSTIVPLTVARPYSELFATRHLLSYHPGSPSQSHLLQHPKSLTSLLVLHPFKKLCLQPHQRQRPMHNLICVETSQRWSPW